MVTEYHLPSNMTDCFQILVRRQQVTVTFQMKPVHTQIHYRQVPLSNYYELLIFS